MIDHVSLGTTHYRDAVGFYSQVLAALGLQLQRDTGAEAAFGTASRWSFFLYPVQEGDSVTAPGMHVALGAASRAQVSGTHAAALAASAQDLWTPRERPDISPTYFGAMFLDLDGHRIEVLTNASCVHRPGRCAETVGTQPRRLSATRARGYGAQGYGSRQRSRPRREPRVTAEAADRVLGAPRQ